MDGAAGRSDRVLHRGAASRRRRHGRGVAGARRSPRAGRGDQAAAPPSGERHRPRRRAAGRGARGQRAQPLQRADRLRRGRSPWCGVSGDRVPGRAVAAGAPEPRPAGRRRGPRRRRAGGARPGRRPRARDRALRSQAGEHLPGRRRPREDPRLRARDAPRAGFARAVRGPGWGHRRAAAGVRHGRLPGTRADARRPRRSPHRHLRARRRRARDDRRPAARRRAGRGPSGIARRGAVRPPLPGADGRGSVCHDR